MVKNHKYRLFSAIFHRKFPTFPKKSENELFPAENFRNFSKIFGGRQTLQINHFCEKSARFAKFSYIFRDGFTVPTLAHISAPPEQNCKNFVLKAKFCPGRRPPAH